MSNNLPKNYPNDIKRLLRQCLFNTQYLNLKVMDYCEDYSMFAIPAFRALEGHIKYLISETGIVLKTNFNYFQKDTNNLNQYIFTPKISDLKKKTNIEICYNFYKLHRDTLCHFGEVSYLNLSNTRFIYSKQESNDLIDRCLNLITTNC
ncbi:RNase LS family HEPN domain-containing protein [Ureaplasma ceti]|uniref:Bacterial toxin RNase RnlA/LsoA DBD domain-containing protein n=1 Tax=Ureaplasma ceti TaxID=3119530 RepID=A0ABP9U640_9BACT